MIDQNNLTEREIIKKVILNPEDIDDVDNFDYKHLNFDIPKLMQYIEPVLIFNEKR